MNKQNQLKLAAFFDEIAEGELAVDLLKVELNAAKGYSAEALFSHISQGASQISIDQLTQYLERKFSVNQRQVYTLFERFDGNRDGCISREDFLRELSPQTSARRGTAGVTNVTAEVQALFISLTKEYIDRERILDICRRDLEGIPPYHAFDQVAIHQRGFLGLGELKDFMKRCDTPLKDDLLKLVLHSLKRRHYRYVTLEVFCENLWPLEFGYYKNFEESLKQQGEEQYLRRSRREDETAEQKRIDQQRIEAEVRKNERRLQAQLERNMEQEREMRHQISRDMEVQARISRREQLEAEKMTRWSAQKDDVLLAEEARLAELARVRRIQAEAVKRNQQALALQLERNARANLYDIEVSRKQIDLDRDAFEREALLQEELRVDLSRQQRAARIAREAEQERALLHSEARLHQERELAYERTKAREALVRRELDYDLRRPAPTAVPIATPPRFQYTLNNYEVPRREGHITSLKYNYDAPRPTTTSYSFSASRPAHNVPNTTQPIPRLSNYAYSAARPAPPVTAAPVTATKVGKDRDLPRTAEDSRKRGNITAERDLKKSYIVD